MQPISTRTHAILDVATVGLMWAMPHLLNCSPRMAKMLHMMGASKLAYALLTRHELGVVRMLPMKTHLALDTIAGGGLCVLPFLLDEDDPATIMACVGQGVFDIAVAPLTQTAAPFDQPAIEQRADQSRQRVAETTSGQRQRNR